MRNSFLIALLGLASCVQPEEAPVGLIPQDTMVMVMMNVHLTEAKISVINLPPDSAKMFYDASRDKFLAKLNISNDRFVKSMDYYTRNLKQFDKIEERVVDSLSLREARGILD